MVCLNKKRSTYISLLVCISLISLLYGVQKLRNASARVEVLFGEVERLETQIAKTHLFENSCKYLWLEDEEPSLKDYIVHARTVSCPRYTIDVLHRSGNGTFSWRDREFSECQVQELGGGLRPGASRTKVTRQENISTEYDMFFVNADNFLITCWRQNKIVLRRHYMGLREESVDGLIVRGEPVLLSPASYEFSSLSIDILALDSTSRSQFMRHMKKTKKVMHELGFVTLNGYNKVGDNSAVNLLPLLAEPPREARQYPNLDDLGDVDLRSILPYNGSIDPDTVDFLWNKMKDIGCETLFNDDIMNLARGLFHYPPDHFKNGFAKKPTDHYYRPFYAHLYKELRNKWKLCLDGRLLAEDFIDIWYQFAKRMAHKCHFSFSFVTSITHDDPNFIEYLDDELSSRLNQLKTTKSLENTVLIIMGDHGNRVALLKSRFAGRIEERQPLMSIYVPPGFRNQFPNAFQHLKNNAMRFTSAFDVHATLLDLVERDVGKQRVGNRGKSLFAKISANRSCVDNNVVKNFCLCMEKEPEDKKLTISSKTLEEKAAEYMRSYNCISQDTLNCEQSEPDRYVPNAMVRVGLRNKIDWEERIKRAKKSNYVYLHRTCTVQSLFNSTLRVEFRFRHDRKDGYDIVFTPMLVPSPGSKCYSERTLEQFCECIQ